MYCNVGLQNCRCLERHFLSVHVTFRHNYKGHISPQGKSLAKGVIPIPFCQSSLIRVSILYPAVFTLLLYMNFHLVLLSLQILIMHFKVVILVSFLSSFAAAESFLYEKERAGGLLGFGLLGGDTTTVASSSDTTTASADTTTASSSDATTAATDDLAGPIQSLIDLLTGASTTLPIADIAGLLGINTTPIPSPFSDPLGFVMHPLITPIILAAITLNIPGMALAQGALAGNLIITHLLVQQAQG